METWFVVFYKGNPQALFVDKRDAEVYGHRYFDDAYKIEKIQRFSDKAAQVLVKRDDISGYVMLFNQSIG